MFINLFSGFSDLMIIIVIMTVLCVVLSLILWRVERKHLLIRNLESEYYGEDDMNREKAELRHEIEKRKRAIAEYLNIFSTGVIDNRTDQTEDMITFLFELETAKAADYGICIESYVSDAAKQYALALDVGKNEKRYNSELDSKTNEKDEFPGVHDLTSIIVNLLDNAIEEVSRGMNLESSAKSGAESYAESKEESQAGSSAESQTESQAEAEQNISQKNIILIQASVLKDVQSSQEFLEIIMRNSVSDIEKVRTIIERKKTEGDDKKITEKDDFSRHGYGTRVIKKITKKYGGEFRFQLEGDTVVTKVTMRIF